DRRPRLRAAARRARRAPAGRARCRARRRAMRRAPVLAVPAFVALAAGLLASPAAPVTAADPPPPKAAGPKVELRVGIPWTPEDLDPTMNLSSIRATVGVSLFDSLVGRDRDNRIVPELAESWKV